MHEIISRNNYYCASMDASSSGTPGAQESRRGKKRLRYEEEWVKKRKLQKDVGVAYTTYKGEQREAKRPAVSLTCQCTYHCRVKISDSERERIFMEFYKLGNYETQNQYLYGLILSENVRRRTKPRGRSESSHVKPRSHTFFDHVRLVDGMQVQVCKTFL